VRRSLLDYAPMRALVPIVCVAVLCLASLPRAQAPAASAMSDPREVPIPPIATGLPSLPDVTQLPTRHAMPDVMTMNDGTKVTTREQWQARREEMRRILLHYAVGHMPAAPRNVKGREVLSELVLDGTVRYRLIRLTFGPDERLGFDVGVWTPVSGGPFPAVILQGGTPPGGAIQPRLPQGPNQGRGENVLLLVGPGPTSAAPPVAPRVGTAAGPPPTAASVATERADALRRGYAIILFNPNDCAEDTTLRNLDGSWAFRKTRFFPAYPAFDWGILAGWAWGASRVADYLEQDSAIDAAKLIITGASRYGKVVTGGGGVGAYRFAGPRNSETLDLMALKYPNWFSPHLRQFRGLREKLPFDQHWFLALAAPRPFIALEGDTDTISLPDAVRQSLLGAQPAYTLLGAADRLGVHYAHHGHAFTADDWAAMLDFFDLHLRGRPTTRVFNRFPTAAELDAAAAALRR
jgi:hypothetical protein